MHKLEKYLAEKKLTQAEFAERIGSSQENVSRYISGTRFPRPRTLARIIEETNGELTAGDFLPLQPMNGLSEPGPTRAA